MAGSRKITSFLAMVALVATAVVAAPGDAGAQDVPIGTVTLTPTPPVPYEPFVVDVDLTGCSPDETLTVTVGIDQHDGDVFIPVPLADVEVTTDGSGALAASIPVPVAYPGWWFVDAPCRGEAMGFTTGFEIVAPASFVLSATPTVAYFDSDLEVAVTGAGCESGEASWAVGTLMRPPAYLVLDSGSAVPAADGSWSADASGHVGNPPEVLVVSIQAACVVDGIEVYYQPFDLLTQAVVGSTTTTGTSTGPAATPRFTG